MGPPQRYRCTATPVDFFDPNVSDDLVEFFPHILSYPRSRSSGMDGGGEGSVDASLAKGNTAMNNSSEVLDPVPTTRRRTSNDDTTSDTSSKRNSLGDGDSNSNRNSNNNSKDDGGRDTADQPSEDNVVPRSTPFHAHRLYPANAHTFQSFKSRFIIFRPGTFRFLRSLVNLSKQLASAHLHAEEFEQHDREVGQNQPLSQAILRHRASHRGTIKLAVYTLSSQHYAKAIVQMLERRLGVPPNSLFETRIIARETNKQPERSATHAISVDVAAKFYWEKAAALYSTFRPAPATSSDDKNVHVDAYQHPRTNSLSDTHASGSDISMEEKGEGNSNSNSTVASLNSLTKMVPTFPPDQDGIIQEMDPLLNYSTMTEEEGIQAFRPLARGLCMLASDYVVQKRSAREMLVRCKRLADFVHPVFNQHGVLVDAVIPEEAIQFRLDVFLRNFINKDANLRGVLMFFYSHVLVPYFARNHDAFLFYKAFGRVAQGQPPNQNISLAVLATHLLRSEDVDTIVNRLFQLLQESLNAFLAPTHDLLHKRYRVLENLISADDSGFRFLLNTYQKGLRANNIPPARAITIDDNRDRIWNPVEALNNLVQIEPFTPLPLNCFHDSQVTSLALNAAALHDRMFEHERSTSLTKYLRELVVAARTESGAGVGTVGTTAAGIRKENNGLGINPTWKGTTVEGSSLVHVQGLCGKTGTSSEQLNEIVSPELLRSLHADEGVVYDTELDRIYDLIAFIGGSFDILRTKTCPVCCATKKRVAGAPRFSPPHSPSERIIFQDITVEALDARLTSLAISTTSPTFDDMGSKTSPTISVSSGSSVTSAGSISSGALSLLSTTGKSVTPASEKLVSSPSLSFVDERYDEDNPPVHIRLDVRKLFRIYLEQRPGKINVLSFPTNIVNPKKTHPSSLTSPTASALNVYSAANSTLASDGGNNVATHRGRFVIKDLSLVLEIPTRFSIPPLNQPVSQSQQFQQQQLIQQASTQTHVRVQQQQQQQQQHRPHTHMHTSNPASHSHTHAQNQQQQHMRQHSHSSHRVQQSALYSSAQSTHNMHPGQASHGHHSPSPSYATSSGQYSNSGHGLPQHQAQTLPQVPISAISDSSHTHQIQPQS